MKTLQEIEPDDRSPLQIWKSVDTWADQKSFWEKKNKPYVNPWEIRSYPGSEEKITGVKVFPHKKIWLRTPKRWCQLLLFYLIFYTVLFSCTISLYQFFFHIIRSPQDKPMYYDLILLSRGVTVLPRLQEGDLGVNNCSSLPYIPFNLKGNPSSINFLSSYTNKQKYGATCSFQIPKPEGKWCNFDTSLLGPCATGNTPCFIVRLTRTIDWVPVVYKNQKELPARFPKSLKKIFKSTAQNERDVIWLHCFGLNKKDRKNIKSMLYHPPQRSFPAYYFPFTQQKHYQDPLVAVEIKIKSKSKVAIKCRVWAKNIEHDDPDMATITFLFFVK